MDLIPLHIEYLLTRHDCVIMPGIGAFIAAETEATIDFDRGIIVPRRRAITFNGSVVTDDGLLSHSIARSEHLPYEEAHKILLALTERMKEDLQQEGEVSIGMVGKLVKDAEGFINFEPRKSDIESDIFPQASISMHKNSFDVAVDYEESEKAFDNADDCLKNDGMRTIRVAPDKYVFTVSKRAVHAAAMLITIFTICLSLMIPINHDNEQKASVISIEDFFQRVVKTESTIKVDTSATPLSSDSIASVEVFPTR